MNSKDFISTLAQAAGTTTADATSMVANLCQSITTTLMTGEAVVIPDFGTFEVKKKMERIIINPSTKCRMLVPPKLVLAFRQSPKLKERLSRGDDNSQPSTTNSQLIFAVIEQALHSEGIVKVKGLGTFKVIDVEARQSVSVNTGERVTIDSYRKVTFTPDATMRELINEPFAIFDTVILDDANATITTTPTEEPTNTDDTDTDEPTPTDMGDVGGQFIAPETDPEEQEEQEEEDEESHALRNWALVGAVLVLIFITLHLSYRFGYVTDLSLNRITSFISNLNHQLPSDTTNTHSVGGQFIAPETPHPQTDTTLQQTDTTDTNSNPNSQLSTLNSQLPVDYAAMDNRVRTGAYVITGTDREVIVRKGETVSKIAQRYLGPGMECYVEVYNGIPRGGTINPDDTIRIPKVKHK